MNNIRLVGEDYSDTLSKNCIEALKFLNIYASKVHVNQDDVKLIDYSYSQVLSLLEELGLSYNISIAVVNKVIELAHDYHNQVDTLLGSIATCRLIDFDWSFKV